LCQKAALCELELLSLDSSHEESRRFRRNLKALLRGGFEAPFAAAGFIAIASSLTGELDGRHRDGKPKSIARRKCATDCPAPH